MQSNRDKAVQARDTANRKISEGDFNEAKKFLLIAENLFPSLEGLSQMFSIVEIHTVPKRNRVLMDWYGILQVDSDAEDETIKQRYRRLALVLHPDKNPYAGAETAFKLLGEGLSILSNKEKRAQHDEERRWGQIKRKDRKEEQENSPNNKEKKAQHDQKRRRWRQNRRKERYEEQEKSPNNKEKQAEEDKKKPYFHTSCPNCKVIYSFPRVFENRETPCRDCQHRYVVRDIFDAGTGNKR